MEAGKVGGEKERSHKVTTKERSHYLPLMMSCSLVFVLQRCLNASRCIVNASAYIVNASAYIANASAYITKCIDLHC